jgi:hypothetical protein
MTLQVCFHFCATKRNIFKIAQQDASFYSFSQLRMSKDQPELTLPENLFLSDNFFKVRWHGIGNRRLKTCIVILQWIYPGQAAPVFACITLAEAETIRWMMQNSPSFDSYCVSLFALSGEMLAQTSAHAAAAAAAALHNQSATAERQSVLQVCSIINNESFTKTYFVYFKFLRNCYHDHVRIHNFLIGPALLSPYPRFKECRNLVRYFTAFA